MKKLVPYVNLETVKDKEGKIEQFIVRTVSYLPADSNPPKEVIEGPIADNVLYRPLTIPYDGTSDKFNYFGVDFIINRADVGLLERGVKVLVKYTGVSAKAMSTSSDNLTDPTGDSGGTIVEYEDEDLP